jgi:hypothetical protein
MSKERVRKKIENCKHDHIATFQGSGTYQCIKCGREIDMMED